MMLVGIRYFGNNLIKGDLVKRRITLSFTKVCLEIARQAVSFFLSIRGSSEEVTKIKKKFIMERTP
jgi:hypothetical protein